MLPQAVISEHECIDALLLKIEQTLFCLCSSPTNNPVTGCIQTNKVDSKVVGFGNLFYSENLFQMVNCSKNKRAVAWMEND